jgi:ATPase subunit of ABC transporter with duplicated ATPase domains
VPDVSAVPDQGAVPDQSRPADLILRVARLRAARRVLVARQVGLSAAAGDVVAVEGVNGAGKSTLLAAAAGRSRVPAAADGWLCG